MPDTTLKTISGTIVDASPHLLVLINRHRRELRLPMSERTSVWHGGEDDATALRPGREVLVRPTESGLAADRIWVDIARVTGTILERGRDTLEVDAGPHRGHKHVVIPTKALGRVLVRHPRLEPGYLVDVIGVRAYAGAGMVGLFPGTSQPGYRTDELPEQMITGSPPPVIRGTATWFVDAEDIDARGAAYPAIDPWGDAGGCHDAPRSCAGLPYMSLDSELRIRNDCSGRTATVAITECGCVAARYCDRCVQCSTSPRGRVVELTAASFVDLGGDLDAGCFNARVVVG